MKKLGGFSTVLCAALVFAAGCTSTGQNPPTPVVSPTVAPVSFQPSTKPQINTGFSGTICSIAFEGSAMRIGTHNTDGSFRSSTMMYMSSRTIHVGNERTFVPVGGGRYVPTDADRSDTFPVLDTCKSLEGVIHVDKPTVQATALPMRVCKVAYQDGWLIVSTPTGNFPAALTEAANISVGDKLPFELATKGKQAVIQVAGNPVDTGGSGCK